MNELDLWKLIRLLDETDVRTVHISADGCNILISKDVIASHEAAEFLAHGRSAPAAESGVGALAPNDIQTATPDSEEPIVGGEVRTTAGANEVAERAVGATAVALVRAPIVGIFYRASQPDVPPFVEAGDVVEEGTTVGLIETMKVFTAVRAGVRGRIVEALAHDRQLVEYDTPLFSVEVP